MRTVVFRGQEGRRASRAGSFYTYKGHDTEGTGERPTTCKTLTHTLDLIEAILTPLGISSPHSPNKSVEGERPLLLLKMTEKTEVIRTTGIDTLGN